MRDAWECESCHCLQSPDAEGHDVEYAGVLVAVCVECWDACYADDAAARTFPALDDAVKDWDRTGVLRVGLLRQLLDRWDLDDWTPVVITSDSWYVNVRHLESEQTDADYACLTLFSGAPWDARSL